MKSLKRLALSSLVSISAGGAALHACEGHRSACVDAPALLWSLDPSKTLAGEVASYQKAFYVRCKEPGCGYATSLTYWAKYEDAVKTAQVHSDMAHGGRVINILITYR